MTPVAAVTMTLVALFVEPWGVTGDSCPFHCCPTMPARPTCVHVLSCRAQPQRGRMATNEVHKRCLQRLLRSCGAPYFLNEDITSSDHEGDRIDMVVLPGALHMRGDPDFERKGVALDNCVCAPTAAKYCERGAAATVNGFAARSAEAHKRARYVGHFNAERWVVVPFVQETFGRLGGAARAFIARLAMHAAARVGGSERVFADKAKECEDACAEQALSVDSVKLALLGRCVSVFAMGWLQLPLHEMDELYSCTERLGGVMAFVLVKETQQLMLRKLWLDVAQGVKLDSAPDPDSGSYSDAPLTPFDVLVNMLDAYIRSKSFHCTPFL
ncbi:hypothetical protein JKP88DRAFT_248821 [Tribonema minus]|uniref:Uncharacterized protein n=1 Tax=Tribonema minus TaxID=303371 RepID=A0A836C8R9_9STRA|nr:hypothetical protein JKP88DRAFT_248821 [Tribonema minus]